MVMAASNASLASSDENILAEQGEVFGSYIDEVLCMVKANGDRYYYSTNDLYSVYALTDSTGTVVERYMFDPYGKVTVLDQNGTPKAETTYSAYGNPWTFTGRRLDSETGLMYFRNRMYDVELGRFVGRDPKEYIDSWSLYGAGFVPKGTDPSGAEIVEAYVDRWRALAEALATNPPIGREVVALMHATAKAFSYLPQMIAYARANYRSTDECCPQKAKYVEDTPPLQKGTEVFYKFQHRYQLSGGRKYEKCKGGQSVVTVCVNAVSPFSVLSIHEKIPDWPGRFGGEMPFDASGLSTNFDYWSNLGWWGGDRGAICIDLGFFWVMNSKEFVSAKALMFRNYRGQRDDEDNQELFKGIKYF